MSENTQQPHPVNNDSNKSNRRKLFNLHSWVGFHLAFLMAVVLATGTVATLSNEIDWLIHKEIRVTPSNKKVSWQTMTDSIAEYAPNGQITVIQSLGADYLAYRADIKDSSNRRYYIYVNQWTGKVTGETGLITVQRVFRDLHRYLFMPSVIGLPIVGSLGFILLISLYTGLKTSRNWRTLMTRIRLNKGARVLIGDAHKAAGLWSIWFIILIAVTGIWYLAELSGSITNYATGSDKYSFQTARPKIPNEHLEDFGNIINTPTTSKIIQAAEAALPEIKGDITRIYFPLAPNQTVRAMGQRDGSILRSRANQVFLNPENLDVVKIHRSENLSVVAWLNNLADPLHYGTFGGLTTKLIWFVFGVGLTGLSVTGVALTWKRLKTKSVSRTQLKTLPVLFIATLSFYFYWYPIFSVPEKQHSELQLIKNINNEFDIEVHLGMDKNNTPDGRIRVILKAHTGIVNIKAITISLHKNSVLIKETKKLKLKLFAKNSLYTTSLSKEELTKADEILLSTELNTGKVVTNSWQINPQ